LRNFAGKYDDNMHIKAWLIANPVSGGGKWADAEPDIVELLTPGMTLTVKTSTEQLSARQLANEAKAAGANLIIACGGDGTVGEVAAELVNTEIPLGIIPLGTTNALCHALWGISSKLMPVRSACLNILDGQSRAIDTARCNDHIMLLLAGVGFEQQMIESANRQRKNELGQLAYLEGFWQAVQSNKMQPLHVRFDDREEQVIQTSSFIIANAAPMTTLLAQGKGAPDMTDGQLDVTWIIHNGDDSSPLGSLAELVFTGLTQVPLEDGNTRHCRAQRVRVRTDNEFKYVIDGEPFSTDHLDIKILPASLRVMLPPSAEPTTAEKTEARRSGINN
jgi:diacylglycerol kinase family enzyme